MWYEDGYVGIRVFEWCAWVSQGLGEVRWSGVGWGGVGWGGVGWGGVGWGGVGWGGVG